MNRYLIFKVKQFVQLCFMFLVVKFVDIMNIENDKSMIEFSSDFNHFCEINALIKNQESYRLFLFVISNNLNRNLGNIKKLMI
jgi:hypothetical protein